MKTSNFYTDWKTMKDGMRFQTPSPRPETGAFYDTTGLPFYRNYNYESGYSITYNSIHKDDSPDDYWLMQAAIMHYNNVHLMEQGGVSLDSYKHALEEALHGISNWRGNESLRNLKDAISYSVWRVVEDDKDWALRLHVIRSIRHWWYGDAIESLKGKDRSQAKVEARAEVNHIGIVEDIREVSDQYREDNFNVLPTIPQIEPEVTYAYNTIKKHGKGYYMDTKENRIERIKAIRSSFPSITQVKASEQLNLNVATIRRYWTA